MPILLQPPQAAVNIDDAVAAIKTWQRGQVVASVGVVAHLSVADMEPGNINAVVNFNDVFVIVVALTGHPYPFEPADVDGHCPLVGPIMMNGIAAAVPPAPNRCPLWNQAKRGLLSHGPTP